MPLMCDWLIQTKDYSSPLHFAVGHEPLVEAPHPLPKKALVRSATHSPASPRAPPTASSTSWPLDPARSLWQHTSETAAVQLLRNGADLHARLNRLTPTPLEMARELEERGELRLRSAALAVLRAAEPWSVHNHKLFPREARMRVHELLLLGPLLAAKVRPHGGEARAMVDVWCRCVIPQAVYRFTRVPRIQREETRPKDRTQEAREARETRKYLRRVRRAYSGI